MRFREFKLFEYDQSKTLAAYGAKLSQDQQQALAILTNIEAIDPSRNKQYVVWLVKQHLAGQPVLDNATEVTELLTNFERLKPRLDQRDINRYSLEQLSAAITAVLNPELGTDTQGNYEVPKGAKVLYNGPLGVLTQPQTHKASCELGSGTKWCTTARKSDEFNEYNRNGEIYIWRDRSGEKYQFWVSTSEKYSRDLDLYFEIRDDSNSSLAPDVMKKMQTNPVVSKLLSHIKAKLDATFQPSEYEYRWFKETRNIDKIAKNPNYAVKYAYTVLKSRWPEAEPVIATDPSAAINYVMAVLDYQRWPEAEPVIATDPSAAMKYAERVLKRRWPEAEPVIATDPRTALYYAQDVLVGRFPEAESTIASDPEFAYFYALGILKGRFPDAEDTIATDPRFAYGYAKNVLKDQFPAGENVINSSSSYAPLYQKFLNSLKGDETNK